jgi:hypothetical protein
MVRAILRVFLAAVLAAAAALLLSGCSADEERSTDFGPPPDLGPPPGTYTVLSDDGTIRIPFEIFRDDILMIAEVKGLELRMLIDNGSLWDQLLFFGSPRIDALGLVHDGEIEVGGSGAGDPVMADTASDITIRFPDVEFSGQTAVITPYDSGLTTLWEGADGQVSAAFFKHFVVDIDFGEMVITLTPPESYRYDGGGRAVPLEPASFGSWTIPGEIVTVDGSMIALDLMLDLGDLHALSLTTGGPAAIPLPGNALEAHLGFGVQGEILGHVGRVREVRVAGYTLTDVLAGFTAAEEGERTDDDAYIGFGLLRRFNIVLDYPHGRMYFEPNRHFVEPFEYDMSGVKLARETDGNVSIRRVDPGSPAAEAGLEEGDEIVRIDGRPAGEYKYWDIEPLLRREGGVVTLTISRGGREEDVSLRLRRLI